VCILWWWVFSL